MKKEVIVLIFILFIFVGVGCIVTSFNENNVGEPSHLISTAYGSSDYIKGWINISLDNEPSNSLFESSKGDSISLIDLINKNPLFEKVCSPENCESDYVGENGEEQKKFCSIKEESETVYKCLNGQKIGDVNGDNEINLEDANIISEIFAGNSLMPEEICCADVNKDGNLDILDSLLISQYVSSGEYPSAYISGTCTVEEVSCSLEAEEFSNSVLFGLKFTGNSVEQLSDFSFDVTSTNPESEKLPLAIDILNDGTNEWEAYEASNNFGFYNYGCFKDFGDTELAYIGSQTQYCEKIRIKKTPEVEIGAHVKGDVPIDFDMTIKNSNLGISKTCTATSTGAGEETISCVPSGFSVDKERDYFVCIKTKNNEEEPPQIAYESNEPCGFAGTYTGSYSKDFEIFVRPKKYASSISFKLNNDELGNSDSYLVSLENYLENYIDSKYNGDCSNECVIPIKILSEAEQEITVSNLQGEYLSDDILNLASEFYDLDETPATISTPEDKKFQKLNLDKGNFSVPSSYGNYTFSLNLEDEEIFSEDISIEEVTEISDLRPRKTGAGYPTKFEAVIGLGEEIVKYEWDFGDNKTETTTTNKVVHTYNSIKKYDLTLTITDSAGKTSSQTFTINVGSAKDIIDELLPQALTNLNNVKTQLGEFNSFEKQELESVLNLNEAESSLEQIQQLNASASSESDYGEILGEILSIDIPESIVVSTSADSLFFYIDSNNIDLDILETVGGGNYGTNREEYKESIVAWNEQNMDTQMSFKEFSAVYEFSEDSILKIFELDITKKDATSTPYLIMQEFDNINFKDDYSEKAESGYVYTRLTEEVTEITFSTTEDVSILGLPAFISPGINELSIDDIITEKDEQLLKLAFLILVLVLLAIVGVVLYLILHTWYKKKYEGYLFKNRNDLYNLISYVQNSRKKEMKNKDIASKLRKSGWKGEQINYVLKRYAGKRVGMPEIPLGKISKLFKKNEGIKKPEGKSDKKI